MKVQKTIPITIADELKCVVFLAQSFAEASDNPDEIAHAVKKYVNQYANACAKYVIDEKRKGNKGVEVGKKMTKAQLFS